MIKPSLINQAFMRELPFHHLVYYSPWQNKMIKPSLINQAFMQNCYNKQFYYVLNV